MNTGDVLTVQGSGTDVSIYDLEISGQKGLSDEAVELNANGGVPRLSLIRVKLRFNDGLAIRVNGGEITIRNSVIASNAGGGVAVSNGGNFQIVGNIFFDNGDVNSIVGAISISTATSSTNRLEFNSFHANMVQSGIGNGIQCAAGVFTARNNIVSDNGTVANSMQIGGTCAHAYSIVRPGVLPAGPGNSAADPQFIDGAMGNLRLRAGSPAIDAADPSSDLTGIAAFDIDGEPRRAPADIGADEVP